MPESLSSNESDHEKFVQKTHSRPLSDVTEMESQMNSLNFNNSVDPVQQTVDTSTDTVITHISVLRAQKPLEASTTSKHEPVSLLKRDSVLSEVGCRRTSSPSRSRSSFNGNFEDKENFKKLVLDDPRFKALVNKIRSETLLSASSTPQRSRENSDSIASTPSNTQDRNDVDCENLFEDVKTVQIPQHQNDENSDDLIAHVKTVQIPQHSTDRHCDDSTVHVETVQIPHHPNDEICDDLTAHVKTVQIPKHPNDENRDDSTAQVKTVQIPHQPNDRKCDDLTAHVETVRIPHHPNDEICDDLTTHVGTVRVPQHPNDENRDDSTANVKTSQNPHHPNDGNCNNLTAHVKTVRILRHPNDENLDGSTAHVNTLSPTDPLSPICTFSAYCVSYYI